MLSNTATPKYYSEFRNKVLSGEIPICKEIEMEMNRIDGLVANPDFYYDEQAIDGFVSYCETEMTLTDGAPLELLPTFKLWAESLFGWWYFVDRTVWIPSENGGQGHYETIREKKRLIDRQYLIVARGAAKSMYAAMIQSYFLNIDTTTTHQVTTAPTMAQAEEVMSPIRTAITRSPGPLFKFLTAGSLQNTTGNQANRKMLASTKKGIQNFLTGSLIEVRPMRIDKLQGLRPKVCTIDEWLSGDLRENVIEALEQGASKIDGYIILATSSEGTVRNAAGDTVKMELLDILKGKFYDPHTSIWYYRLDDVKEVGNPDMWLKAQPNLGKTVSYETYQRAVDRMESSPSTKNDILAKRFGIPTEGYTYYFAYEETIAHRRREFWEMPCTMGMDLSQGDDFCAFTFLFPLADGGFGVKTRCFISERTFISLPTAARFKYEEFINEGSLIVLDGTILDMLQVYDEIDKFIDNQKYDVLAVGYDPYNAKSFVERWGQEHGEYGIVKVPQGSRTESVPLGELKALAEDRKLIFDQELMQYAMGNCIALEDTNGNRKLYKARREQKIDAVSAMLDAFVAYKANRDLLE